MIERILAEFENPEFWVAVAFFLAVIPLIRPAVKGVKEWSKGQAAGVQKELDEAAASEVPASGLVQIDEGSVVVVEDDAGTDVPENSETARTSAMAALEERAMQELMKISRADPGISPKKNPVKEGFSKWRRRR